MNDGRNIHLGFWWDDNDFFKVSPHKKSNYPYTVIDMKALQLYSCEIYVETKYWQQGSKLHLGR